MERPIGHATRRLGALLAAALLAAGCSSGQAVASEATSPGLAPSATPVVSSPSLAPSPPPVTTYDGDLPVGDLKAGTTYALGWEHEAAPRHRARQGPSHYEPFTYGKGQHDTVYIVDVDGTLWVIDTNYLPGTSKATLVEFEQHVASIRVEP